MSGHRYGPGDVARDALTAATRRLPGGPLTPERLAAGYRREAPSLLGWLLAIQITRWFVNIVPSPWGLLAVAPWTLYLWRSVHKTDSGGSVQLYIDEHGNVTTCPHTPTCDHDCTDKDTP